VFAAEPSAAQKSAGNYPKHHVNVRGLRISIENPAGSVRRGTAPDGAEWATELKHHYGYIRGTQGKDKDHLDVFLGPEPHAPHAVHIVNQVNEDGAFDEHKIMLGFPDKTSAIDAYHANYEEGWRGADTVATMTWPKFRAWATSGKKIAPARDAGKLPDPEPKGYAAGGSLTPLSNLGGYMYTTPTPGAAPLTFSGTAQLIGAPGSDLGGSGGQGSSGNVSGAAGGISAGTLGNALSTVGQLSGTPELGLMGGFIGAAGAAQNGNYGPVGGLIGGLTAGRGGALLGGLAGSYASNTLSGRSVANTVLGMAVPGYGMLNGLTNGALGAGLFGIDGSWNSLGVHTPAVPGVFGDWGLTAGTTAVNAANNAAGRTGIDPMDALMGVTGAFGTAPGAVNSGINNSGAVPGGPEDNAPGFGGGGYGSPGAGDNNGSVSDTSSGIGADQSSDSTNGFAEGGRIGYQVKGALVDRQDTHAPTRLRLASSRGLSGYTT
jgi:hypothetical protein